MKCLKCDGEGKRHGIGKVGAIIGWTLCVLFLILGLATGGASLIFFLIAALLINPIFRNHVYISGKIWIPLVIILFIAGMATTSTTDSEPKKVAEKQEAPAASVKKQAKASAKKQTKKASEVKKAAKEKAKKEEQKRAAQEQAEREEQERIAQEQAEQERIAQEEAAAKAEQERIAQEQAAAAQAEQERIAQEQAEQQRIAQEQAAAQQAEQERIAQEQAEQQRVAQEQAALQANANPQPPAEGMVWVTETGKRYHCTNNCGNTNSSTAYQIPLSEAQQKNMQPCKNCYN